MKDMKMKLSKEFSSESVHETQKSEFSLQLSRKYEKSIDGIKAINFQIDNRFHILEQLKANFLKIKEKKFIKGFLNIMDRMSNQLQSSTEKYEEIDKQINSDPQCIYLEGQLGFFKKECLEAHKNMQSRKEILKKQKQKHKNLLKQKQSLEGKLRSTTSKQLKYKAKTQSLYEKSVELYQPFFTHRESATSNQTRRRSMTHRNYSVQIDLASSRPSEHRKIPTANIQKRFKNISQFIRN